MKTFGLPREERIRRQDVIRRIVKQGSCRRRHGLALFFVPAETQQTCFIVKKRVGMAVQRNRLKRWLREIYRQYRPAGKEGLAMVWVVERQWNTSGLDFLRFRDTMHTLLNEAWQCQRTRDPAQQPPTDGAPAVHLDTQTR